MSEINVLTLRCIKKKKIKVLFIIFSNIYYSQIIAIKIIYS